MPPAGKKRTAAGDLKPSNPSTSSDPSQRTPTCAQPQQSPNVSSVEVSDLSGAASVISDKAPAAPILSRNSSAQRRAKEKRQKLAHLPDNATVSRRPLLHPAIPSPFTSSSSPKCVYITASSPFIPAVKRIRGLLSEIEKRSHQSQASTISGIFAGARHGGRGGLKANGRLTANEVEKAIAEGSSTKTKSGGGPGAEEVFVKATGRAIPRALELGNYFQKQGDCRVRVMIGSVSAIDDIDIVQVPESEEIRRGKKDGHAEGGNENESADADAVESDEPNVGVTRAEGANVQKKTRRGRIAKEEDIPETRIRTLSAITVAISLK